MTAKTIVTALTAAMGLAASASVIEVKFTVKTENKDTGKVASKVISGLYNTDSNEHVFWTVEKQANEKGKKVNVNVPYVNTYFGLVNDTTVAKKVGQNAELIWGDATNPENVLVAGAWGTAASKSGQVAGTLNGVPATGTWSAKVNTKKSYADLLAKYGLKQVENKETGVIADLETAKKELEEAKQALADTNAALEKANDDLAADKAALESDKTALEATIAGLESDKTALETTIAGLQSKVAKLNGEVSRLNGDVANAKAQLAGKVEELEKMTAQFDTLVGALNDVDDEELPNMISDYLDTTEDQAKALKKEAQGLIDAANDKFDAYTNSLDVASLQGDVTDAEAEVTSTSSALVAATATVDALTLTNNMIIAIYGKTLDTDFASKISTKQGEINAKEDELTTAKEGFVSYTNNLASAIVDLSDQLTKKEKDVSEKQTAKEEAEGVLKTAKEALAAFDPDDVERLTFDSFLAEEDPDGTIYTSELKKIAAYDAYVDATIAKAKKPFSTAVDNAQDDVDTKTGLYNTAVGEYDNIKDQLAKKQKLLKQAEETGTTPDIDKIEAELDELEQELDDIEADYKFWKNYQYSDADRVQIEADLDAAEEAKQAASAAFDEAKVALKDAKDALKNMATTQSARLAELAAEIGETLTDDLTGAALSVEAIRAKVDYYIEDKPLGGSEGRSLKDCVTSADTTLAAVANIRAKLEIEDDEDESEPQD